MNINWNDAPPWANYAAMDADGEWWWYASKPALSVDQGAWLAPRGEYESVDKVHLDWQDTLEIRPGTE